MGDFLLDHPFLAYLVMMAAIVGFSLAIVYGAARQECVHTSRAMNLEHRFGFWEGCLVDVNGRWVPLDTYRSVEGNER